VTNFLTRILVTPDYRSHGLFAAALRCRSRLRGAQDDIENMNPKISHIAKYPPSIGSRVKVWFGTKERHLIVKDETGRLTYDIYGMPLAASYSRLR
jgi:hypothetical protein